MDYFQKRTFFFFFIFLSYGLDLHLGEYSKRWSIILSIQNIYVMETSLYSSAGDEIQGMHITKQTDSNETKNMSKVVTRKNFKRI